MIGVTGERLVEHYSFYAAFETPEEYRLVTKGRTLGSMPITAAVIVGMYLIFAGRRWRVESVEEQRKVIDLIPAGGGRPPKFTGTGAPVGDRIRERMLEVYCSEVVPAYLDETARELLMEGRKTFRDAGLEKASLIPSGEDTLLFPWTADRVMNTLQILFLDRGLRCENRGVALRVENAEPDVVLHQLDVIASSETADPLALAALVANKRVEKYDGLLSEDLLCLEYAARGVDVAGARDVARSMVRRAAVASRTAFSSRDGAGLIEMESKSLPSRIEGREGPPVRIVIASDTRAAARAVLALPSSGPLPSRTVLVPNNRVAHALRRELVRSGDPAAIAGILFIPRSRRQSRSSAEPAWCLPKARTSFVRSACWLYSGATWTSDTLILRSSANRPDGKTPSRARSASSRRQDFPLGICRRMVGDPRI